MSGIAKFTPEELAELRTFDEAVEKQCEFEFRHWGRHRTENSPPAVRTKPYSTGPVKAKTQKYHDKYYAEHAERLREYERKYYAEHKEHCKEVNKAYYLTHKDYFRKKSSERRERERCQREQEFQQKENGKRSTCSSSGERRKESVLF